MKPKKKKFVMYDKKQRKEIMKNYNEINKGKKPCTSYPLSKVMAAAKGMYVYPNDVLKEKGKRELCGEIKRSYKKKKDPIVHENSMTVWTNQAAEQYGLEIRDILKMKPGEKMEVILMDRNIGDYMHGTKKGTKYSPLKKGLRYATYTHKKGLSGKLDMHDIKLVHECFQWEINLKSIGYGWFWGPILKGVKIKKLDPKIKVGWRGPAIRLDDAKKYLPKLVTHYDTWWDDYAPNRYHNYLKVERIKK